MTDPIHAGGLRSLLYIPAHVERFVAKAPGSGADAVIFDLEDSVPEDRKPTARQALASAVAAAHVAGVRPLVRINRPLRMAVQDLEAAVLPEVQAILVTKVDGASHLRLLDELVSDLEAERRLPPGAIRFIPVIEDPQGVLDMRAIFAATPRNVAALLGGEDLAQACGMVSSEETLRAVRQQLVLCARASGLLPLGLLGSLAGTADDDAYRDMLTRSRRFGFAGATCIHPGQVASLNQAFTPSEVEVAWARRALQAYEDACREGRGAVAVDGKMVDRPVAERARGLLRLAEVAQAQAPSGGSSGYP